MLAELFGLGIRSPRNASVENPRVSLHDPESWRQLGIGAESEAGVTVTPQTGLSIAPVWQAVSLLSGDMALPLNVYARSGDDWQIDYKHPAQHVLTVAANSEMSAFQFWRTFAVHLLLWGNAYALIRRAGGAVGPVVEMVNLLPDRTKPMRTRDTGELYYVTEVDGRLEPLMKEQVLHQRGLAVDRDRGCDLVTHARNSWGLSLAAERFASRFFKMGGRHGGILEIPAAFSKQALDQLETGFRKTYEKIDAAFMTVILREGAKFHAAQVSPEQGQMVESREEQVREVARWYNLPPSKLGLKDAVSYNSQEQDDLRYLNGCLRHLLKAKEAECELKLLTEQERRQRTHRLRHDTSELIETDERTKNEVLERQRRNEIISANEWRRKIGLPPRSDPGGNEYANPNTRSASSSAGEGAATAAVRRRLPESHRQLLAETVSRIARRIAGDARQHAKSPQKFCEWLDGGAAEQRALFAEAVGPVLAACGEASGGDGAAMLRVVAEQFFAQFIEGLNALTKPPYQVGQLAANVDQFCERFARSAGVDAVLLLGEDESLRPVVHVHLPEMPAPQVTVAAPVVNMPRPVAVYREIIRDEKGRIAGIKDIPLSDCKEN